VRSTSHHPGGHVEARAPVRNVHPSGHRKVVALPQLPPVKECHWHHVPDRHLAAQAPILFPPPHRRWYDLCMAIVCGWRDSRVRDTTCERDTAGIAQYLVRVCWDATILVLKVVMLYHICYILSGLPKPNPMTHCHKPWPTAYPRTHSQKPCPTLPYGQQPQTLPNPNPGPTTPNLGQPNSNTHSPP
jgi:hypothetical protein